jgi:Holliday junction resolvase
MVTEERVVNLEAAVANFIAQSNRIIAAIHEDVAEIRASNARTDRQLLEMQQQAERDRQQADKDRKDFNKRMAEISDSMGTLIEDMVAPCGFQLARAIFQTEEAQTCGIRLRAKHPRNPGEMMELDLLAIGPTKVLVVEVKRRIDAAKITEYRQKLARLAEFFPELAGKTLLPAVASVYLEASVVTFLNREKVYGIAMGDEVMEVINLGKF